MNPRVIPAALRTGAEEQAVVRDVFASAGAIVYSTSDPRATRSTPGLSDLFVIFPGRKLFLAWDSKAGDEQYKPTDARRLSVEQQRFGAHLAKGLRTAFAWGDAEAAKVYLMEKR